MGEFSEIYYALIFFLLALIQDEIKGVISSILCFLMITLSGEFLELTDTYKIYFFESMLAYDTIFFLAGMFLLGSKAGNSLILVSVLSLTFNTVCMLFYPHFKLTIQENYGLINLILFEILLYGQFTSTKLYPVIKSKFVVLEQWISKRVHEKLTG